MIEWYEDGSRELYNVSSDPGETSNLATEQPDRVKELATPLANWRTETNAAMPVPNPKYDPQKRNGRAADRPAQKKERSKSDGTDSLLGFVPA